MKIAIMSPWNDCCGVSVHAELIGREWIKQGHEIVVFAATDERVKGRIPVDTKDEEYVYRNWEKYRYGEKVRDESELDLYFDAEPILKEDYDLFVIEKPCLTPLAKLLKIFPQIKEKAKTIAIIHEGRIPENVNFYKFDWDLYTLFDQRFKKLFENHLPKEKTHIISYPCHEITEGNMTEKRSELGLPLDKKIILAFGMRLKHLREVFPIFEELKKSYDISPLMFTSHQENIEIAKKLVDGYEFAIFRQESPPMERLYKYLHASDAILIHRPPASDYSPTSSTVHLCLGGMHPLICPENNVFEIFDRAVIKYSNLAELKGRLLDIVEARGIDSIIEAARKYVMENSAGNVAKKLVKLVDTR